MRHAVISGTATLAAFAILLFDLTGVSFGWRDAMVVMLIGLAWNSAGRV